LSDLADMGIDIITGDNLTSVVVQGGIGDIDLNDPGLRFADGKNYERNLSVTLQLTDADQNVDTGTVNLNTSLSALAAMGIDTITGDTDTSVVIQGGIDGFDLDATDLRFADGAPGENDLDVTLQLTDADQNADTGTVNLNTSLNALDAMGIDTITGEAGTSVLIQGGLGGLDLAATDLRFTDSGANDLYVTLQTDLADLATTNLSTSLSALADMGIDTVNLNNSLNDLSRFGTITGDSGNSLVIQGGIGGFDLDATDLRFTDSGTSDLDVTLETDLADLATTNLSTSLGALADMGIDTVNLNNSLNDLSRFGAITGDSGTSLVIQGGMDGLDLAATDLSFTDSGTSDLDVTLDVTDDIANGTVSLSTTHLNALSAMGIDTITGDAGTSVLFQGGGEMTLSDIMGLGLSFDNDLDVTLSIGDAAALADFGLTDADLQADSSFMLGNTDAAIALKDMGIDFINGDGVSGVWTEQDDD
jgi:hypothetical protein